MKNKMDKKLLVFSAHPDDDILCAGTILYLKSLGFKIFEVVFTSGENSINLKGPQDKKVLKNVRENEFKKSAKILGVDGFEFLGLPNDDITRSFDLINKLVRIIRREKPTILISENPKDYHVDHRIIGIMTQEAIDRAGWGVSPELGEKFKTPLGLFKTGEYIQNSRLDLLVDIEKFYPQKLKVMKAYSSQAGSFSFQLNDALDRYAGFFLRTKFAESFELINNYPVRFKDLIESMKV